MGEIRREECLDRRPDAQGIVDNETRASRGTDRIKEE